MCAIRPISWYFIAVITFFFGMLLAARHYPGGYDWAYTVVSALASRKENPDGSYWFSAAIALSMLMLWPYLSAIRRQLGRAQPFERYSMAALRVGVIGGVLVGGERLLVYDLSSWLNKSHELIALITFLALYFGSLGLLIRRMRDQRMYLLPLLAVAAPLLVLGLVEFVLYLQQRDIGWVGVPWREMETPLWASFAFWQWMLVIFLWLGIGSLSFGWTAHAEHSDG